ncbi:uncharacterized protein LOC133457437 [Cololabis saira]|uniref:uncharacterized protein LOC133457437 n=1 Tax=Cololabis saira TaxID=129043 RepID=UPI002AD4EE1E|nr:uncharacterized protein LOC133457437 [Cololabis saira]
MGRAGNQLKLRRVSGAVSNLKGKMHNWQENEIKELLSIRGSEAIRSQITGTVKDSVVYSRVTALLAERGVFRSHMQVISKLKALRKQYTKFQQQSLHSRGGGRVHWLFFELCHRAFSPGGAQGGRRRSPAPTAATPELTAELTPPPAPVADSPAGGQEMEVREVEVRLWEDEEEEEISKHISTHLGPVEDEEEEQDRGERMPSINATYSVPTKKRKTTVMEQVSTLVSATVAQLREMDAAMQAQEDARLQRLMKHEREMQNNLISELMVMNERISRENHERNLELVDRILSRFPSPSASLDH